MEKADWVQVYQISDHFAMHWNGTDFTLYNISRSRGVIRCNSVEASVILAINEPWMNE
jgi:hypothetical protein